MEGSRGKSGGKGGPKAAKKLRQPRASKARAKAKAKTDAARSESATTEIEAVKPEKPKASTARASKAPPRTVKPAKATKPKKPAAAAAKAAKPKAKAERKPKPKPKPKKPAKDPSRDLWFRFSTRVRAVGYWLREKWQALAKAARAGGERLGDFWVKRTSGQRIGIGVGAAVLLLALFIRFVPAPGIPCGISAVKECAPEERSFGLVPADALLYAHLTLDRDSEQFERARDAFEQLSDLRTILTAELPQALPTPSGTPIDIATDVLPWAERDLAVTLLPGPGETSLQAFTVGVADREGADAFLAKVAPSGEPKQVAVGEEQLSVYPGGFSAAFIGDSVVFGDEKAVRASLNANSGEAPALQDSPEPQAVRDELPEARFAEVYLSRSGVQRLLAGRSGTATQLETFIDYGATDGVAAAAVAREGGIEIDLVSSLNPKLAKKSPSFFSELPEFEPTLASEAGSRSIGYVGLGDVGPTLAELLERKGSGGGLAGSLRGLSAQLRAEAGVDPLTDLLPALEGQAALVAEPTDGVPFASLIVDGIDEDRVAQALAQLQKPLLRSIGTSGGAQVPRFEEQEVEGVPVRSVQVSATVNLSYAVFDDKLVISTDPAGIAQVRDEGDGLAGSEPYERATDQLPERVSALVFLNLDELFGQVTRTDLVEDPFFANLSVLFDNATSVGLAVNGEDEQIRSELFLATD